MKKKLIPFIFLFIVLCFSCDNSSINRFVSKTTIKPFSELKDPVVLIQQISCQNKIFGMQVSSKIIGSVLMVVDFENHKLFDWIYVPELYTFDFPYCCEVKIDENKTIYCASLSSSGKIVVLDPEKTTLEYIDTGMKNIGNICHKEAPKGVIYTSMEVKCDDPSVTLGIGEKFTAYDFKNKKGESNINVINSRRINSSYEVFDNGDLLFPRYTSKIAEFYRVSHENLGNDKFFSYEGESTHDYCVYPVRFPISIVDENIFLTKSQEEYKNYKLLVLTNQNQSYSLKEISLPEKYSSFNFCKVFKMGEEYYSAIFEPRGINEKELFVKLDLQKNNIDENQVHDFFKDNHTKGDLFVRGNRIYYLDFSNNLVFSYYDFSDNTSNTITAPKL